MVERQLHTGGLLVSAYPPGTDVAGHRRTYRDQLLAALCRATVVITAGQRSGAYHTATTAYRLRRPVFAFAGPRTDPVHTGANHLLREGRATVLTRPADITLPATEDPRARRDAQPAPTNAPGTSGVRTPSAPDRAFRVVWEIDVETIDPRTAARRALAIQRNPQSDATVFRVHDPDGTVHTVDLA